MKWFIRLNDWYDGLREPLRFMLFFVVISLPFVCAITGTFSNVVNGIIIAVVGLWTVGRSYLMTK